MKQNRLTDYTQSGQIGIAILLTMTVLLTMGLSVASRSTEDLFLSQQQTESARVFNAAEAGIEEALSTELDFVGDSATGTLNIADTDVEYEIAKQNFLETRVFEGDTVQVDVDNSGSGTGLTSNQDILIQWSKETDCSTQDPASLIAAVFYDDAGVTKVRYYAFEGCSHGDGFAASSNGTGGYFKQTTLPLLTNDLFVRIKAIYNDTYVRVIGSGWTLPVQGYNIRSEARNQLGDEFRAVEVNRTLDSAPSIVDFSLFSGTTIIK